MHLKVDLFVAHQHQRKEQNCSADESFVMFMFLCCDKSQGQKHFLRSKKVRVSLKGSLLLASSFPLNCCRCKKLKHLFVLDDRKMLSAHMYKHVIR